MPSYQTFLVSVHSCLFFIMMHLKHGAEDGKDAYFPWLFL